MNLDLLPLLALAPYAAVAVGLTVTLVLFLSLKADMHRTARRERLRVDAALARLQEAHPVTEREPVLVPASGVTGLNLRQLKEEVRERVTFIGGSLEFLHAVKASGRALWLVTNAHPDSWQVKLEQVQLTPMFDAIISSHDYGAPKEDPRFWQALQSQHPFDPSRALFADDSLPVLRAARDYGIGHVVAMSRPDSRLPPRPMEDFIAAEGLGALLPL